MLRVGVIGIGEQARDNILPSIVHIDNALTVAVCDIDKHKADLAAIKYGATAYYNYDLMLENEDLDAIIVSSYPNVHYDVGKKALNRGIPIFIEKPPTFTLEELLDLIDSNKHNVVTGVGLNFNYAETVNSVDQLSKNQDFGKIKYLSISHYGNKPKKPIWGLDSTIKSFLLAQAIHPIGFITKYGDKVLKSDIKAIKSFGDIFVSGNFLLGNKNGEEVIAHLSSGNMSPYFMWRLELITDQSIVIRINSLWELEIFDNNKKTNLINNTKRWKDVWNPSPLSNGYSRTGYYNQFNNFFEAIQNKKRFSADLESLIPVYKILNLLEKELESKNENISE